MNLKTLFFITRKNKTKLCCGLNLSDTKKKKKYNKINLKKNSCVFSYLYNMSKYE